MKSTRTAEIVILVFVLILTTSFLIFYHFFDKESEDTKTLFLPKESALKDNQQTKYKKHAVKVRLTKYQLEKMLLLLEEKNGYYNNFNGWYVPALPQDYMTFRSTAKGVEEELEISSTQLSKYTGDKTIQESILNEQ